MSGRRRRLLASLLLLALPASALNTGAIVSATYAGAASCLNIRLIGLCFWLVCDGFWCDIEVSPKWGSYHPDAVVPAYAQTALTPWVEMRPVMAAFAAAASSAAGAIGGSWSLGGGEQVDRARDQEGARMLFREADVIGHPLGPLPVIFGISCPAPIVPFMPYFVSSIDGLGWRLPELEWLLYPSSLIPGLREIGHWPMNTWGPVHPRTGYLLTPDPAKAGAVAAQRAGDIVTRAGQFPHIYQSLPGSDDGDATDSPSSGSIMALPQTWWEWGALIVRARSGDHGYDDEDSVFGHLVWVPQEPLVETEGSTGLWQMLTPTPEASCSTFGENDTAQVRAWSAGRDTSDRQYAWTLWRPYRCCMELDGFYLGSIDWMGYP